MKNAVAEHVVRCMTAAEGEPVADVLAVDMKNAVVGQPVAGIVVAAVDMKNAVAEHVVHCKTAAEGEPVAGIVVAAVDKYVVAVWVVDMGQDVEEDTSAGVSSLCASCIPFSFSSDKELS